MSLIFRQVAAVAATKIKAKLLLAFLGLSLLIGVSGGVGLFFVKRTGATISFISHVTSPLLVDSMSLAANAQRTRATFLDGLNGGRGKTDLEVDLSRLEGNARNRLDDLGRLSDQIGLKVRHEELGLLQQQFGQTLRDIVAAHFAVQATRSTLDESLTEFEAERRQFDALVRTIATQVETKIAENEDKAKIQVQTGAATVAWLGDLFSQTMNESFPVLQGMYKLMRESEKLQELSNTYASETSTAALASMEQNARATVKGGTVIVQKLAGRFRAGDKVLISNAMQSLGALERLLFGNDGVVSARRASLEADVRLAGLKQTLGFVETDYVRVLSEVEQQVQSQNEQANGNALQGVTRALLIVGTVIVIGVLASIVFGVLFANRIIGPVQRLTRAMTQLADGALDVMVPERFRRDEIGDMASALQVFKDNAINSKHVVAEREAEQVARDQRSRRMAERCAMHEQSVTGMLDALHSAAREMKEASEAMSAVIVATGQQAVTTAAATERAAGSVQTVATAAEELSSSVAEINQKAIYSAKIANKAVEESTRTDGMVQELQDTAMQIGQVVRIIEQIANQTNLLALNATIEAARAGEAGRGFAVVASEVKTLAGQTAKATTEIGGRINAIQSATQHVVVAIKGIRNTIDEMRKISDFVAATMEMQGSSTQEIAENTQQVALSAGDISRNTQAVSESMTSTKAAATRAVGAAADLARQADALRNETAQFLDDVRAA